MKLSNDYSTINSKKSIQEVIDEALENNEYFFSMYVGEEVFIYRPITRLEYKNILEDTAISEEDKKDAICRKCLLYPDSYDFDNCLAGVPEQLSADIIEKSALDPVSVLSLISIGREEMQDLTSQIVCMIASEFPAYRIEEIESWNMYKLIDMFTKAEWKRNFNSQYENVDIGSAIVSSLIDASGLKEENDEDEEDTSSQLEEKPVKNNRNKKRQNGMSEEEYQEYLKFAQKFPEIDMGADAAFTGYDENMKVDTLPPALRPGWG